MYSIAFFFLNGMTIVILFLTEKIALLLVSEISLLIIPCIIYHVTNKETLNLDLDKALKIDR